MRYRFADLELDTVAGTVRRGDEMLDTGGLTLSFLTALVQAAPEPLDADQLAAQVWRRDHVSDDTIRKRASLLRAAIGAELVRTLPDQRYALSKPVTNASEDALDQQAGASKQSGEDEDGAPTGLMIQPAMIAGAVFIVVLLGLTLWGSLRSEAPPRLVNPETGHVLEAPER
jgi:DNA-binding winged helix-turn-helix (wHTH) protein